MITDVIISSFLACLVAITSVIPIPTLPAYDSTNSIFSLASHFALIVPLGYMGMLAAAYLALELLFYSFDLAVFIYHQFWGSD